MAKEAPDYHKERLKKSSLIPTKINRRAWISNSLKFAIPPILAGGYARFESNWFDFTKTRIKSANLAGDQTIKILHISDLHLSKVISVEQIESALKKGFQSQPHACMITGDFVTDMPNNDQLEGLSKCLGK